MGPEKIWNYIFRAVRTIPYEQAQSVNRGKNKCKLILGCFPCTKKNLEISVYVRNVRLGNRTLHLEDYFPSPDHLEKHTSTNSFQN